MPFSKASKESADEETLAHPTAFAHDLNATRTALESGQFQHLASYADRSSRCLSPVQLHRAPNDPDCHYLMRHDVRRTLDKKGKPPESTTAICKHLAMSAATYCDLKARFGQPLVSGAISV